MDRKIHMGEGDLSSVAEMVIRVLIVCDIRLYGEGVILLLERQTNIEMAPLVTDGRAARLAVRDYQPNVILVDAAMPDGLAIVRDMIESDPTTRVIALAVLDTEQEVFACIEAGACGYISRQAAGSDLVATIESVARGEAIVSPRMVASILRRVKALAGDHATGIRRAHLTSREVEIVKLLESGLSNKHIASRLNIELSTVKNHVHNILEKLRVHRRSDVAREVSVWSPRRSDGDLSGRG